MSLRSGHDGIVAQAAVSGKTPADAPLRQWTVGAAVFFVMLGAAYLVLGGLPPTLQP
jgi:hypothetical protein